MAFSEFETRMFEKKVSKFIEECGHANDRADLAFRIKGLEGELFRLRSQWDNPSETIEIPVAKAKYVKAKKLWKVYWLREDLQWDRYDPEPHADTIDKFLSIVAEDEFACFFG